MGIITSIIPKSNRGDAIVALLKFVKWHRRLPSQRMQFQDYLYRVKASGKLSDPLCIETTDKVTVKDYIRRTVGSEFVVPTLGILTTIEEVNLNVFREGTVVKPSHMSGQVRILRNPDDVIALDKNQLKQWLSTNFYEVSREQNYKDLDPRIIIEEIIFGPDIPKDYKIFCFKGVTKFVQVDGERFGQHWRSFFDTRGVPLDFSLNFPPAPEPEELPSNFEEMLRVASALSQDFEFVRVDMYSNGSEIKVGELTHCPSSAKQAFRPDSKASSMLFRNEIVDSF